jgi:hypothetical protein
MGDSRKAIAEDIAEYGEICKHFGEPDTEGPYSEHARLLKSLWQTERELHRKHRDHLRQRNAALSKLTPEDKRALGLPK